MSITKVSPNVVDDQVIGRRNVIINGSMQVAQRGTSTADLGGSGVNTFGACDRWKIVTNGISGRVTQSQETDSPDDFGFSTKLACTTADTSVGASDYFILQYDVEGQDLKRFAKGTSSAKEFTISFFVKGNASATYTLELYDTDNNRQISKTYSVTTSWSRVELTYPADTTGANNADSTSGLSIKFWLHAGTDRTSGTLNSSAWGDGGNTSNRVSSSSTNFFDSTSRTFFITGVQLEVGDTATPFEYRSFGEELSLCQRYCQKYGPYGSSSFPYGPSGYSYAATTTAVGQILPVELRGDPTISFGGAGNPELRGGETAGSNSGRAVTSVNFIKARGASLMMNVTTSGGGNESGQTAVLCNASNNNFMIYDAEI